MGLRIVSVVLLVACTGGSNSDEPPASLPPSAELQRFELTNSGDPGLEGHTPRGFQGQGGGLFTGDNINPNFPMGDGVQIFLTLPLDGGLDGLTVATAQLSGEPTEVRGTPFADLGDLILDEMRFQQFSSSLWDREPVDGGVSCVFAVSPEHDFGCDITPAVQRALDDGRDAVQVRLRFETAGDSDGSPDMVMFFGADSNTTSPGLFDLVIEAS